MKQHWLLMMTSSAKNWIALRRLWQNASIVWTLHVSSNRNRCANATKIPCKRSSNVLLLLNKSSRTSLRMLFSKKKVIIKKSEDLTSLSVISLSKKFTRGISDLWRRMTRAIKLTLINCTSTWRTSVKFSNREKWSARLHSEKNWHSLRPSAVSNMTRRFAPSSMITRNNFASVMCNSKNPFLNNVKSLSKSKRRSLSHAKKRRRRFEPTLTKSLTRQRIKSREKAN
mmetsp:Transcript_6070/g.22956  ORF Transcript_6070/g.22956 Transcript_6070/m.22956 type:complete len:227 (+) Transcript_6070:6408-7088(+)